MVQRKIFFMTAHRLFIILLVVFSCMLPAMASEEHLRSSVYNNVYELFTLLRAITVPVSCVNICYQLIQIMIDPDDDNNKTRWTNIIQCCIGIVVFMISPGIIDRAITLGFGVGGTGMDAG